VKCPFRPRSPAPEIGLPAPCNPLLELKRLIFF
jgi:hypothetical protein